MGLGLKESILLSSILCIFHAGWSIQREGSSSSEMEIELQVERELKQLNKPAVKSIQSEDGDIIDCVDIYKQPAFDHPLLKNHTIQMKPTHDPFQAEEETASPPPTSSSLKQDSKPLLLSSQVWRRNGSCPVGTIPIRRIQKHHLVNAPSIKNYGKKITTDIKKYELQSLKKPLAIGIEARHAVNWLIASGYSYTGARALINVWNPHVADNDEFSSGQISLRNGPFNNSDEIDFGWIVNPAVYGDRRTRLFAFWTKDSGKSTGCFDLICSGFVQTNHEIALGSVLEPVSQIYGPQYHMDVYVWKDFETDHGNWWLVFANTTTIGYWPSTIFNTMYVSTLVLFGGDVYSPRMRQSPHTATAMGSGQYANQHWGSAAFMREPRVRDMALNIKYPDPSQIFSLHPFCYSAENYGEKFTEPLFYYGGPGLNVNCP